MNQESLSLSYAVRPAVIGKHLGQLGIMLSLLTIVPTVVSVFFGETDYTVRYVLVIGALSALSLPALRLKSAEHVQTNEALVIGALAFVLTSVIMTVPLAASGLPWLDALFESVSGVTTTGLTTLASVEDKSPTFLFSRSWMQWYGGLGIAVLSVALLLGQHLASRRLMDTDRPDSLLTTARGYARQVLIGYLGLSIVGIGLVWAVSDSGFVALVHVLSAVSTGGFSTFDDSLAGFDSSAPRYILTLLSLCGALPLVIYYRIIHRGPMALFRDPEVHTLTLAALLTSVLLGIAMSLQSAGGWLGTFGQAVMLGISAQTTTGFSTLSVASLGPLALLVAAVAMAVGGAVGSSAGGLKLLRVLIGIQVFRYFIRRPAMPDHAVLEMRVGNRAIQQEDVGRVLMLTVLFATVVLVSWAIFVAYGYQPLAALFEVVSAVATVGLSTGITRPELEAPLKLLLCADMLLGRLEFVALLVLFYPRTWIGRRARTS